VKVANLFTALPEDLSEEVFEHIVQNDAVTIERIVSKGHSSPAEGWYDQEKHEWVMVLAGEAVLAFEDLTEVRLLPGDHITIPAHTRHKVKWTAPETETLWLAVHY